MTKCPQVEILELREQRDAVLTALIELANVEIKGHALIYRLAFSENGRALERLIRDAVKLAGGVIK